MTPLRKLLRFRMLESTFLHCAGIGRGMERRLWAEGITHWDSVSDGCLAPGIGKVRRKALQEMVRVSRVALSLRDHAFFAASLPSTEHWRAVSSFPGKIAYLDIETSM